MHLHILIWVFAHLIMNGINIDLVYTATMNQLSAVAVFVGTAIATLFVQRAVTPSFRVHRLRQRDKLAAADSSGRGGSGRQHRLASLPRDGTRAEQAGRNTRP